MNQAKALLVDVSKCIGCGACVEACMQAHGQKGDYEAVKDLSANNFTAVQEKGDYYVRRMCMHCLQPTCVSVCPVAALQKTADGPVVYEASRCIGCRYCMQACPFEVPRYEWGSLVPRVQKCRMCYERVAAGGQTACAEACPTGATQFGDREELVAEARKRITENPGQYIDHVYGLTEAGGTSVLYLSNVPFQDLGLPMNLPGEPIPELSWKVLSQIPKYTVAASVVLFGIHWITARRAEVARFEAEERERTLAQHESR